MSRCVRQEACWIKQVSRRVPSERRAKRGTYLRLGRELREQGLSGARDQDVHAPDPLDDLARRLGVQAWVVGYGSDRCGTRLDSDENGARGAAARVPAVRRGHTQRRPGADPAVPKL